MPIRDVFYIASSFVFIAIIALSAATSTVHRPFKLGSTTLLFGQCRWNLADNLAAHAVTLDCDSVFITDFGPFEERHDDFSINKCEIRRYGSWTEGIDISSWIME